MIFEHCRNFLTKRRELTIVSRRCDTGDEDDFQVTINKLFKDRVLVITAISR